MAIRPSDLPEIFTANAALRLLIIGSRTGQVPPTLNSDLADGDAQIGTIRINSLTPFLGLTKPEIIAILEGNPAIRGLDYNSLSNRPTGTGGGIDRAALITILQALRGNERIPYVSLDLTGLPYNRIANRLVVGGNSGLITTRDGDGNDNLAINIDNVTIDLNNGRIEVKRGGISNVHLNSGIDASKILRGLNPHVDPTKEAPGSIAFFDSNRILGALRGVSAFELSHLEGIESNIQVQIAQLIGQVGSLERGVNVLAPVQAVATTDFTITNTSGLTVGTSVDGYLLKANDRVLLTAQTDAHRNGIYVVNAGAAPTRAGDANEYSELVFAETFVENGQNWRHSIWVCTLATAPTEDDDNIASGSQRLALNWIRRLSLDQNFLDRFIPFVGSDTRSMTGPLLLRNANPDDPFRDNEAINKEYVDDEIADAASRAIDIDSLDEEDTFQDDDEIAISIPETEFVPRPTNLQSVTDFAFQGRGLRATDVLDIGLFQRDPLTATHSQYFLLPGTNVIDAQIPNTPRTPTTPVDHVIVENDTRREVIIQHLVGQVRMDMGAILFSQQAKQVIVLTDFNEIQLTMRITAGRLTPNQREITATWAANIAQVKYQGDSDFTDIGGFVFDLVDLQVAALFPNGNTVEGLNLFLLPITSEENHQFRNRIDILLSNTIYIEHPTENQTKKISGRTLLKRVSDLASSLIAPVEEQVLRLIQGENIPFKMTILGIQGIAIESPGDLPTSFNLLVETQGANEQGDDPVIVTLGGLVLNILDINGNAIDQSINPVVLEPGTSTISVGFRNANDLATVIANAERDLYFNLQMLKGVADSDMFHRSLVRQQSTIPRGAVGTAFVESAVKDSSGDYNFISPTSNFNEVPTIGLFATANDPFIGYTAGGAKIQHTSNRVAAMGPIPTADRSFAQLLTSSRTGAGLNLPTAPSDSVFAAEWQNRIGDYDFYVDNLNISYIAAADPLINVANGINVGDTLPVDIGGVGRECFDASVLSIDTRNRLINVRLRRNEYRAASNRRHPYRTPATGGLGLIFRIPGQVYVTRVGPQLVWWGSPTVPDNAIKIADVAMTVGNRTVGGVTQPYPLITHYRTVDIFRENYRNKNTISWEWVNNTTYRTTAPGFANVGGKEVHVAQGTTIEIDDHATDIKNEITAANGGVTAGTTWVFWNIDEDGTITPSAQFPNRDINGSSIRPGRGARTILQTRIVRTIVDLRRGTTTEVFTQDYNWFPDYKYNTEKRVPTEDFLRLAGPAAGSSRYPTLVGEPSFSGGVTRVPFKRGLFTISDFAALNGSQVMDHNFEVIFELFNAFSSRSLSITNQPSVVANEYVEYSTMIGNSRSSSGAYGKIRLIGDRRHQADLDNEFPG